MRELQRKDAGNGNPMEAEWITLRPGGVWPGNQNPWGEHEDTEVQCRFPGEKDDGHPSLGQPWAAPVPGHRGTHYLAVLILGLTLETLVWCFTDGLSGVLSTVMVGRAGNGTVLMPKELDAILGPNPHERMSCINCPSFIRSTGFGKPLLRRPPATVFLGTFRIV